MIVDLDVFLEHYGVQGMKWGQRKAANKASVQRLVGKGLSKRKAKRTVRYQNRIDAQKMAAMGRQGKVGVLKQLNNRAISNMTLGPGAILRHPLSTKKAAAKQLQTSKQIQEKVAAGKRSATATLLRIQGVSIKDIDFST